MKALRSQLTRYRDRYRYRSDDLWLRNEYTRESRVEHGVQLGTQYSSQAQHSGLRYGERSSFRYDECVCKRLHDVNRIIRGVLDQDHNAIANPEISLAQTLAQVIGTRPGACHPGGCQRVLNAQLHLECRAAARLWRTGLRVRNRCRST